jgi:hypothetical protein
MVADAVSSKHPPVADKEGTTARSMARARLELRLRVVPRTSEPEIKLDKDLDE